jgi:hypothetical protein
VGLVLLGLAYPVIRVLEGYFLVRAYAPRWMYYPLWPLSWLLLWRQRSAFEALTRDRKQRRNPDRRRVAAWRLDVYFPPGEEDLLPTGLGNAIRAFELHSWKRYGLDGVGAWPRVELLLSEQERELLEGAQTELAFFVNSSLASAFAAALWFADWIAFRSHRLEDVWWLVPLVLTYLLYRGAVEAATRWGDEVRSCMDLHRLTLYEQLGLRIPASNAEERELATQVSRFFLYGRDVSDTFRRRSGEPEGETEAPNPEQPRRRLERMLVVALVALHALKRRGPADPRARRT